ncbi:MAG: DUF2127 domain-containing protein [Actinomycetota bacterium]|nr:DUF2127 domain-containing protein [Actinomycetota bacterium]
MSTPPQTKPAGPPVEGRKTGRWHPETFVCAFRGHRVPAAQVRRLRADDWLVGIEADGGGHLGRCLRCDAWVLADPGMATHDDLGATDLEIPERGKKLRDSLVLKAIAVDRGVHSFVFALLAVGLLFLRWDLVSLQNQARTLVDNTSIGLAGTGQATSRSFLLKELDRLIGLDPKTLRLLLFTAVVYAVIEGVEAVGLWRGRRWAEYLTALATAGFLPLEIGELLNKVSVGRVIALIINLAMLVYLVWAKHLFGIRGGATEDEHELEAGERLPVLAGQRLAGEGDS